MREVFVHNVPKKKNLLHFLHRCHGFIETSKLQSLDPRRLAKALKRRKRPDPLQILAKASLIEHGWLGNPSPNFLFVNCEFLCQTQVFLPDGSHPPRDPFIWLLCSMKTQHLWIWHEKLHMLTHFQEILWSFGPPESQKTSKKWLSATFLTHRKKYWEIAILEG